MNNCSTATSFYVQEACCRYIYLGLVVAVWGYIAAKSVIEWYPKFKQSIYDDKYLIGKRLHNFADRTLNRNSSNNNAQLLQEEEKEEAEDITVVN
jgi:hypothetical protein